MAHAVEGGTGAGGAASMQTATGPGPRKPMVIVVTGPTAVGKTAVGLALAHKLGGEVVSADSVQVYQGLDVGSDKLPLDQREGVPHHLLDVRHPGTDYSAGDFHDEGRAAVADVIARGKVPIVVGGTGFYLRWLVGGKAGGPRTTPEAAAAVRAAIDGAWAAAAAARGLGNVDELSADDKWEAGVALLGAWGDTAAMERVRVERNNYYRLERALALVHMTGGRRADMDVPSRQRASSASRDEGGEEEEGAGAGGQEEDDPEGSQYDWRLYFLHRPRLELYARIDGRVEEMVVGGLVDEAAGLLVEHGMAPGTTCATRAVGYRQAMEWLLMMAEPGRPAVCGDDLRALVAAVAKATHRLVRSQMVWFRDDAEYKWIDVVGAGGAEGVVSAILTDLEAPCHTGGCAPGSGRLEAEEARTLKSRSLTTPLLDAQPARVAAVCDHVNRVLLPRLRAHEGVMRQVAEAIAVRQAAAEAAAAKAAERAAEKRARGEAKAVAAGTTGGRQQRKRGASQQPPAAAASH